MKDWTLENSFNVVSDFVDSMPGNSLVTGPEKIIRASSPNSLSSRIAFLREASFQTYQTLNQKLETLEPQMDELSILLAQSYLRREKLLARSLAQSQSMSAAVHFESATINIPDNADTKDELITIIPSTSSMKGQRVPSTPNSCSAKNCGTRVLSANAVSEAETAPTPNLFQNHQSTTATDSVCNPHFPGTKSLLLT